MRGTWAVPKFRKTSDERNMYEPLTTIFRHIEICQDSPSKRAFRCKETTALKSDESTWGFPKSTPDFILLERSTDALWRHALGFCEIKCATYKGPKPTNPKVVKPLVCQAADFAGLHLSGRPFHLFSVGLLIFGSQFCVAIFDRAGVLFSSIHDMWEDTENFIRVVRSLTCLLTPLDLGQDPTVTLLPELQHKLRIDEIKHLGREAPENSPTFVISACTSSRLWYTVGLPIWTSVSLLGRGTSIWLVQEDGVGPVYVLKNTWRSSSRLSESVIYNSVEGHHPALAKLHQGGDVLFSGEDRCISAYSLRGSASASDSEGDVVLHRLLLESRGRPLWEYTSEKELLQGIRAALSAHQFLCNEGILHRDISAGNVMLAAEPASAPGAEGILLDLEFAHIKRASLNTVPKIYVPPVQTPSGKMTAPAMRSHTIFGLDFIGPDVLHGAAMTGTTQFMAAPILEAILKNVLIEHEPTHDVESFIYVLVRRAVHDSAGLDENTRGNLRVFFHANFGRMGLYDVLVSRGGAEPLKIPPRVPGAFSEPITKLFATLAAVLFSAKIKVLVLDHQLLLSFSDTAIVEMS